MTRSALVLAFYLCLLPAAVTAQPPPVRLDHHGDPLPPHAIGRIGPVRFNHGDSINALAFSPDGKTIASIGEHGVLFWKTATGQLLGEYRLDEAAYCPHLAFAPDGKHVAIVCAASAVALYEVATGKVARKLTCDNFVRMVRFAHNGRLLAIEARGLIQLWDTATGKCLRTVRYGDESALDLAFSADDRTLLAIRDGALRRWDVGTGKLLGASQLPGSLVTAARFSPDGSVLAACQLNRRWGLCLDRVCLWDAATGEQLRYLPPWVQGNFFSNDELAFSADGKTLACVIDDGVRLFEVATGRELRHLEQWQWVRQLTFSPDGTALACTDGYRVRVWDLAANRERVPPGSHSTLWLDLALSPDGKRLAAFDTEREQVGLWDTVTGKQRLSLRWQPGSGDCIAVGPGGDLLAVAARSEHVFLHELPSGKHRFTLGGHKEGVTALAFSPDRQTLAVASYDTWIRLWHVGTGKLLRTLEGKGSPDWSWQIAFSPDGALLASVTDNVTPGVRLWDVATGASKTVGPDDREAAFGGHCVAFSPDGRLLAVGQDIGSVVRVLELVSGKVIWEKQHQSRQGQLRDMAVVFSACGRGLVSGHPSEVRVWDAWTGATRARLDGHRNRVWRLAVSRDGGVLASSSSDGTALLWDIRPLVRPQPQPAKHTQAALRAAWDDLAGADTAKAYVALAALVDAGDPAVALVNTGLRPVAPLDEQRVKKLLTDLGDPRFAVRDQATAGLRKYGELLVPTLRQRLKTPTSLEQRRRLESLLALWEGDSPSAEVLRTCRAVAVLEHIGTPAASEVLRTLANGAPGARLTREAAAALKRLTRS